MLMMLALMMLGLARVLMMLRLIDARGDADADDAEAGCFMLHSEAENARLLMLMTLGADDAAEAGARADGAY